ncbi:MAG: hypothetical protein QOD99_230 [Chthoniobacter sp.]|jgi:outer membrane protein OmpA-like peptidoglycan-associated protein|nr:hypothetical protein [Chthoniobacter sp.]
MPYLETYQSNAAETPIMRKWLIRMFVVSVCLHLSLIAFFRATTLDRFNPTPDHVVRRVFSVERLDVDPKLLENEQSEPPKPPAEKTPSLKPIDVPDEKPDLDKIIENTRITPIAPELTKAIAMDKPRIEGTNLQALAMQQSAAREMENDLKSLNRNLLQDRPKAQSTSLLKYSATAEAGAGNSDAAGMAAAGHQLDSLLQNGIGGGEKPLSMPGGALFGFGKAELNLAVIDQLRKLGQLIRKSPRVVFVIEGHTDSFGDDMSNDRLSADRAEAVRTWLVQNMDIDPARIQTHGFGRRKLVVPPSPEFNPADPHFIASPTQAQIDAEIARQSKNRRVEIVFTFPKGN